MAERPNITDQFDPEQIYQIIEQYLSVAGRRQYIGARYVPIFGRVGEDSIVWDNSAPYEPLTIVLYQGNSFTSRQYVPTGVDINNEEFWACTGNYNAQIEAYRREVLNVTEDVNDLKAVMPFDKFTSQSTIYDLINSKGTFDDAQLKQAYLGRLHLAEFPGLSPQGFCIAENTGIFSLTDDTDCKFVYINMTNGNYINTIDGEGMGHCNSMCYNDSTDKVYVVPNHINNVKSNLMWVCNPFTMQIEETIDLGFNGHSVTVDAKTGKMYVSSETTIDGNYAIGVYEFNPSDKTTVQLGTIIVSLGRLDVLGDSRGTIGSQQLTAYDGEFYFLIGGHVNLIEHFNSSLEFQEFINIDSECFIHTVIEMQGIQILENGAIVCYSLASNYCNTQVGLISALLNGKSYDSYDTDLLRGNYYRYSRCQENANGLNSNIYVTGGENNGFPELSEAISLAVRNNLDTVVYGNVAYEGARVDFSPANIQILGSNAQCSVTFKKSINVNGNLRMEGASTAHRLEVKFNLESAATAPLRNTMSSYFKNVEFDGTNCTNYIGRLHGVNVMTGCEFVNTETLYTKYFDLQQLGIGVGQDVFNNPATIDAIIRA